MACRQRIQTYLSEHHVPFTIHLHDAAYTAQQVAEHEHIPGHALVKVVVVVADGALVLLALPTSRRVDLAQVSTLLNARELRLASEDELVSAFPDCEVGAMPPFGNLYGLPVYVDRSLENERTIFFQAGTHTAAMSIAYHDFKRLVAPTVAEFTYAHHRRTENPIWELRETGGW